MRLAEEPYSDVKMDRRTVLAAALATGAVAAVAARAALAADPPAPQRGPVLASHITAELKPLTGNVWAWLQREGPGESNILLSNCGLIAGPNAMMAIDTTSAPLQAKAFRAAAEAATGKPFDRIVITHEHPDHVLGLPFFPAGVQVVAQEECAVQMAKAVAGPRPPFWNRLAGWADGDEPYRLVMPTRTFKDRLSFEYGPTRVDLIYPGRAHTTGDTMVLLPRERIMFLGDIAFFGVTPLNGSGYVADWIKVCDRILAMQEVQTIVPGHGPVGGKAELADMRDYLILIRREGKKGFDQGKSPAQAAADIDLGKYAGWSDADRVAANMVRLYAEFDGSIKVDQDRAPVNKARLEYAAIIGKKS